MSTINKQTAKRVAVIGGGWAGCAAAVTLADADWHVTLYEASQTLGGRARRVEIDGKPLDNGQHILLGAYAESLRLMRKVGIRTEDVLLRLPLQMRYPAAENGMDFFASNLPAPFHLLIGLLRTKGLDKDDKLALVRFMTAARWIGWHLNEDCTVLNILDRFNQTPRLYGLLWRPLCLAALNTPPERASAQVFLNVLRDSIGAKRSASDMLIPKRDLSALFAERAADFVKQRDGKITLGHPVRQLIQNASGWQIKGNADGDGEGDTFDALVIATPPRPAASLLDGLTDLAALQAFQYEPITTCYLQYPANTRLDNPFYALIDHPEEKKFGQFVFDRGQLDKAQAGLMAVVVSASSHTLSLDEASLSVAIAAQLAKAFNRPELARPLSTKILSEPYATLACTPKLIRPDNATGIDNLVIAGDYTACDYPATLEAAVRSGVRAARALINKDEPLPQTYCCSA
ncbi:MAG: phytoene dehydrogenase [Oxalobacter sp.]|nr:MAG: phytoene dehydrogenase [Oxalobacter sp.]